MLVNEDLKIYNSLINANNRLPEKSKLSFYTFIATHATKYIIDPDGSQDIFRGSLTCCNCLKEPNGRYYIIDKKLINLSDVIELKNYGTIDLKNENRNHMVNPFKTIDSFENIKNPCYVKFFMLMWPAAYDLVNLAEFDFAAAVSKYFSNHESETIVNDMKVLIQYLKSSSKLDLLETSNLPQLSRIMDTICDLDDLSLAENFIENVMVNLKGNYSENIIKFIRKFGWENIGDALSKVIKSTNLKENCQIFFDLYEHDSQSALLFLIHIVFLPLLDINAINSLAEISPKSLNDIACLARIILKFRADEKFGELIRQVYNIADLVPDRKLADEVFVEFLNVNN